MVTTSMADKPNLDAAYALKGPQDVTRLYANWAETYEQDFVDAQGYQMPAHVAEAFVTSGGSGPVLDVGAGTGIGGMALAHHGVGPIDGVDLSTEMLAVAARKGCYRTLTQADITRPLQGLGHYQGIVSAGTFTLGHVGPEGLPALIDVGAAGCLYVIGVNAQHYVRDGFEHALAGLSAQVDLFETRDLRIYDDRADPDHRDDLARLLIFRKR